MKSEHRHELKEHELGKLTHHAQVFFEKYGNQVLLGVLAVVLVIGGTVWWMRSSSATAAAAWSQLASARSSEDFAKVAESYPKTEVAQWARLNEAEGYLVDGITMAFSDREGSNKSLAKAQKEYEEVLRGAPLTDALRERALFGLARTLESGSGRDTEKAVEAYTELDKNFPTSPYRELAARCAKALKTGSEQEFYAWFHAQHPKLEDLQGPKDGLPPGHPPLRKKSDSSVPHPDDLPDFLPPGIGTPDKKPDAKTDAPAEAETPEAAKKPEPDGKPGPEKKPSDKPESETKSEPEKPE